MSPTRSQCARAFLLEGAPTDVDVIVANIIAPVVAELMPDARRHLRRGGTFIGAGIGADRSWSWSRQRPLGTLNIDRIEEKNDWRCMCGPAGGGSMQMSGHSALSVHVDRALL